MMKAVDLMTPANVEAALKTYPELRERTQGMSHDEVLAFLQREGYVSYMVINGEGRLGKRKPTLDR